MWVTRQDGGRLAVESRGHGGLTVVSAHSLPGSRAHWSAQVEHVAGFGRAVAFDLRGMGESDRAGEFGLPAFVNDVEAIAQELELDHFVLCGHSFGAAVAVAYAAAHPEWVQGLLLADPPADLSRWPWEQQREFVEGTQPRSFRAFVKSWYEYLLTHARPSTRSRVLADLSHTPREVIVAAVLAQFAFDLSGALARCRGPRLSVVSEAFDGPAALHAQVPDLPHVTLNGVSHWLAMDAPEAFNLELDRFLLTHGLALADLGVPATL